jgi:hypothetical protein
LAECLAKPLCGHAGDDVGISSGRIRRDQTNRPLRPILRMRCRGADPRECKQRDDRRCDKSSKREIQVRPAAAC